MIKIDRLSERQIYEMFGNPREDSEKVESFLVTVAPPFPLRTESGREVKSVKINRYIADSWLDALEEIETLYGGPDKIRAMSLDIFGGCYNVRGAKGNSKFLSRHSWGLAVDHLMQMGPYGSRDIMPYHFVQAFIKRGWDWGGHWPEMYPGCKILDGMHFSTGG